MNALLIYPNYPDTFWSFKHALKFVDKKAANPPLGLITISAMLPETWNKKLVDINVDKLRHKHIEWADLVFISAMNIQKNSVKEVVKLCKSHNRRIVAGGPLFTEEPENFSEIDHLILNEGETTFRRFLNDFNQGNPRHIYETGEFPDLKQSPLPDFSLLNLKKYASMNVQYTRGCPFNCEFCNITSLFGRSVRFKSSGQIMREIQLLYDLGWRSNIFIVDDNFIGNKRQLKLDLLPKLITWMQDRKYPFDFSTEVSINLADDEELLNSMKKSGFTSVFVGIETPDEKCLASCNKNQNVSRNLLANVNKIQSFGIQVTAGFIVGFDNDKPDIFQRQIDFINKSGIVSSMVGLLNAPRKSMLYQRLKKEGRITNDMTGNNTDFSINFIPKMNKEKLLNGYKRILNEIYSSKQYYKRIKRLLYRFEPNQLSSSRLNPT